MSFIYKSQNVETDIPRFVELTSDLVLYSPYIQSNALRAINSSLNIKTIVVAWNKEDLLKGVSDLELYDYCLENGIELYEGYLKLIDQMGLDNFLSIQV